VYFVYFVVSSSLEGEPMSETPGTKFEQAAATHAERSALGEIWDFLRHNKKWWLLPIVGVLILFGILLILAGTGVAPFLYTLF
jgi:hypothetical protein